TRSRYTTQKIKERKRNYISVNQAYNQKSNVMFFPIIAHVLLKFAPYLRPRIIKILYLCK
ncbi:MAG: hypothetical protein PHX62_07800, partial [Bacilli bacterium]|nr:hypothetical protein [Bacilli bacterium]